MLKIYIGLTVSFLASMEYLVDTLLKSMGL